MEFFEHSHEHVHEHGSPVMHILYHSFIDIIPMILILILTFIAIEYIEHKFSGKLQEKVRRAGILGPVLGSLVGAIPQCGFSVMAVALYSKRIISLGTMMAIFLATSDEAIPVLLTSPESYGSILPMILTKIVLAILFGYIIDFVIVRRPINVDIKSTDNMEKEGAKCIDEEKISLSKVLTHSIERGLKVSIYLYIITVVISLGLEYVHIEHLIGKEHGILQIFIVSLLGLIPNCAISLGIVKLFTMNVIGFPAVIAGLSSNAGLALIYLFKESKSKKKAFIITLMLFVISFISGIIIYAL